MFSLEIGGNKNCLTYHLSPKRMAKKKKKKILKVGGHVLLEKPWEINTLIIACGNANQYNPLGKYLTSMLFYLLTGNFTLRNLPLR